MPLNGLIQKDIRLKAQNVYQLLKEYVKKH